MAAIRWRATPTTTVQARARVQAAPESSSPPVASAGLLGLPQLARPRFDFDGSSRRLLWASRLVIGRHIVRFPGRSGSHSGPTGESLRLALVATGTFLALGTTSAAAGVARAATGSRGDMRLAPATSIPIDKNTVTAGYVSEVKDISSVSTTFEVPAITNCTSASNSGMGPVVILTGSRYFVGAGAEAECQNGTTSYMVAINHNGSEPSPHRRREGSDQRHRHGREDRGGSVNRRHDVAQAGCPERREGEGDRRGLGDDSLFQGSKEVPIPMFTDHNFVSTKINGKVLKVAEPLIDDELVLHNTVLIEPAQSAHPEGTESPDTHLPSARIEKTDFMIKAKRPAMDRTLATRLLGPSLVMYGP